MIHIIRRIIEAAYRVVSYTEDLKPQMILLMGLPAAGKSTFINKDMKKYYPRLPHVKGFKVLNSDSQLKAMQYKRAKNDYVNLKSSPNKNTYDKIASEMEYKTYEGKSIKFPLSYEEMEKIDKFPKFFKITYKTYYATYFGDRAQAQKNVKLLKDAKFTAGDVVILDSTGQDANKYLTMFEESREKGFINSVVYLDIDVEYSIGRDKYRGETEGRSVGEKVIKSIDQKLPSAYSKMKKSPLVDRYLKFKWNGELTSGVYDLVEDRKKYPYKKSK